MSGMNLGDSTAFKRLQVRHLTSLGNLVDQPVTAGVTTLTISFTRSEGKPSYGVGCLPNWLTTVRVTNKTINSLQLDFGTAAPANATLDLLTFRTE